MQQSGTLKKRKRRNLSKVNGLSQIAYNVNEDNFTGDDLFHGGETTSKKISVRHKSETRLRFNSSQLLENRREVASGIPHSRASSHSRVTRNPNFHLDIVEEDIEDQMWTQNESTELVSSLGPFDTRESVPASLKGRECFLDKCAMQRLKQIIWLGIFTGTFPWKWNSKTNRIEKWGPTMEKLWWIQWFFVTIQTWAMFGYQLYICIHAFGNAKTYRAAFQTSFCFLHYSCAVLLNTNLYYYKEDSRMYINTMMRFNYDYVSKYLIHLDGYREGGRSLTKYVVIMCIMQVFVSVIFFVSFPFQPWYLFAHIYPKPWYWLIPGAFQEFIYMGQVMAGYMLICWMLVAHNNTLKFWLSETHNHNDSDYTIDELRHPKTAIETYRVMQVLSNLFNECMAPMGISSIKFCISTVTVASGYVWIRSMNHLFIEEFPAILTYPIGFMNCAIVAFVMTSMSAEVFDLGCSFIDSWSRTKQKDFRRILMSFASLKIWVRRFYFLSVSATVTFFQVVFDFIIDAIMTFP